MANVRVYVLQTTMQATFVKIGMSAIFSSCLNTNDISTDAAGLDAAIQGLLSCLNLSF